MAEEQSRLESPADIQMLLANIKLTVEGILATCTRNVWSTYGGLSRLCHAIEDILYHEIRPVKDVFGNRKDYWLFVQGLKWLQPTFVPFIDKISRMSETDNVSRGCMWLEFSLQDHNLSTQLSALLSNPNYVAKFYTDDAFLRQPPYFHAMCLCLKAVEQNNIAILTDIDLSLLSRQSKLLPDRNKITEKLVKHSVSRNSSEWSSITGTSPLSGSDLSVIENISVSFSEEYASPSTTHSHPLIDCEEISSSDDEADDIGNQSTKETNHSSRDMTTSSLVKTTLNDSTKNSHTKPLEADASHRRDDVIPLQFSTPVSAARGHRRVKSDDVITSVTTSEDGPRSAILRDNDSFDKTSSDSRRVSTSATTPRRSTTCDMLSDGSLIGSGYRASRYLPKPAAGQSLRSYLSSQDFHTCANLDKENAHFSISEALIAAIEQMKSSHVLPAPENSDSDEEIQQLKQRIRIRKREKLKEKERNGTARVNNSNNTSLSSPVSSHLASVYSSSDDGASGSEDVDFELASTDKSNLTMLKDSGLSLSMASLYSDADLQRNNSHLDKPTTGTTLALSAESVAMSLLKKYSEKQLPKASDLDWLVSEQDAPQALLPLPNSYPVSPDDGENADLLLSFQMPRIRGNLEWAPPRPQIIFSIHPPPKRNVILSRQNYRCAGCGMKIEPGFVKRLRYCDYLGKYFCQCCHGNAMAYIPARIIHKWDWTKYRVSNFSRDLLRKMLDEPHYQVADLNPGLVKRVKGLETILECRAQLGYVEKFIRICKHADTLCTTLNRLPKHWLNDEGMFSLADLYKVRTGDMLTEMKALVHLFTAHVRDCTVCSGLGFICELCKDARIIYPFELDTVQNCAACHACYHLACYKESLEVCPKCDRIHKRRSFKISDEEYFDEPKKKTDETIENWENVGLSHHLTVPPCDNQKEHQETRTTHIKECDSDILTNEILADNHMTNTTDGSVDRGDNCNSDIPVNLKLCEC